ncbi:hypothetical protein HAX54_012335, partial [Datura stramonium]|nr:hypothetical protein [Datura stramonium]
LLKEQIKYKLFKMKDGISDARDLDTLTMDVLIGNPKTYEFKKSQEREMTTSHKEKNLVLQATIVEDDNGPAY